MEEFLAAQLGVIEKQFCRFAFVAEEGDFGMDRQNGLANISHVMIAKPP